jgi:DNA-binding NarL/FixJ family response regulator
MESDHLRLVFADDNFLVREGVSGLLGEVDALEVLDAVADPHSLLKVVAESAPDVVLTDIRMPPTFTNEGIVAAKRIRAQHPRTGVVVLSQFVEEDYAYELLEEGVAGLGYLLKERVSDLDELVRALREVARGGSALDPKIVESLLDRRSSEATSPLLGLTDREREVLAEMATGQSNAMIASTLFMSVRAVEKQISSIFQKLDLVDHGDANRRVLAVLAFLDADAERG